MADDRHVKNCYASRLCQGWFDSNTNDYIRSKSKPEVEFQYDNMQFIFLNVSSNILAMDWYYVSSKFGLQINLDLFTCVTER